MFTPHTKVNFQARPGQGFRLACLLLASVLVVELGAGVPVQKYSPFVPDEAQRSTLQSGRISKVSADRPGQVEDSLLAAFLEAAAQPFETDAAGFQAHTGGLEFTLQAGQLSIDSTGLAWQLSVRSLGRSASVPAPVESLDCHLAAQEDRVECAYPG